MQTSPRLPNMRPELRMAMGRVSTPMPMFPFKIWTIVSRLLMLRPSSRSFESKRASSSRDASSPSSSVKGSPEMDKGLEGPRDVARDRDGVATSIGLHIEMVLRLKRSISSKTSAVEIVRFRRRPTAPPNCGLRSSIAACEDPMLPYVLEYKAN